MKKAAVFLAVLLTLAIALAGCGGSRGELSKAGPEDTPAPAVSEESTPAPEPTKAPAAESSSKVESSSKAGQSSEEMLTEEQAKEKALEHAKQDSGSVEFTEIELDYEGGWPVYELEFHAGTYEEYEYKVDGYTGEIISHKRETHGKGSGHGDGHGEGGGNGDPDHERDPNHTGLTGREAKDLVIEKVPGASRQDIWEFGRDVEDGRNVFEGKLIYEGSEYEFKIDGETGEFLEWEQEPADD